MDGKEVGDAISHVRSGVGERAGRGHHRDREPPSARGRPVVHVGAGSRRRRWVHDGRVAVAGHQGPLAGGIRRGRDLPQHGRRQDLARLHPGLRGPGPAQGRCDRMGSVQRQARVGLRRCRSHDRCGRRRGAQPRRRADVGDDLDAGVLLRRCLQRLGRERGSSPIDRPVARRGPQEAEPAVDRDAPRWGQAVGGRRRDLGAGRPSRPARAGDGPRSAGPGHALRGGQSHSGRWCLRDPRCDLGLADVDAVARPSQRGGAGHRRPPPLRRRGAGGCVERRPLAAVADAGRHRAPGPAACARHRRGDDHGGDDQRHGDLVRRVGRRRRLPGRRPDVVPHDLPVSGRRCDLGAAAGQPRRDQADDRWTGGRGVAAGRSTPVAARGRLACRVGRRARPAEPGPPHGRRPGRHLAQHGLRRHLVPHPQGPHRDLPRPAGR